MSKISVKTALTGVRLDPVNDHSKMQDWASRARVSTKALIEDETMDGEGRAKQDAKAKSGCSIVEINKATDDPLSPYPKEV
ncbi:hypothetical protein EKO29_16450 [Colwellia sp. Arc7-635]|uniref:hypothetical protein n=1 Tax=Colwellia sp. Arc7-635 TaxID=2497879 RepID=UPI000F853E11|nr:hypothetical protein [Colwellia sp. Arc7-635]AZQ85433.1 hypothetical protein EKO29_16450 [Colwellia sp. Arc7-635]